MSNTAYTLSLHDALPRSEERRVGKECSIGKSWSIWYSKRGKRSDHQRDDQR